MWGIKWHTAATTSAQQNNEHNMLEPLARICPSLTSAQEDHAAWAASSPTAHSAPMRHHAVAHMFHSSLPREDTSASLKTNLPLLADANSQRGQVGKTSTMCSVCAAAKGHRHRGTDSSSTSPRESWDEDGWK